MRRHFQPLHRAQAALTLVEIMVVVVIMGMISGVVAKVVLDRLQDAKQETAKTQISEFVGALEAFYMDNSFYPTTDQGLAALVKAPTSGRLPVKYSPNGYMKGIPPDPWGTEYIYVSPAANADFEIISLGRDTLEGGEGYDADISSAQIGGVKPE